MRLIRAILLFPYLLYLNFAEKFVKILFKIIFIGVKISEKVPIVGPKISSALRSMADWRVFSWALKDKEE